MTMRHALTFLVAGAVLTAGCATVGPDYTRPDVTVPGAFRDPAPNATAATAGDDATVPDSIADTTWSTLFVDQPLQDLITTALAHNYDIGMAAARVLQARALFGVTRADQFPTVDLGASTQGQRTSLTNTDGEARTVGSLQLGGTAAWEPDFWGRYRRATESARAAILASEWGQRAVTTSLVSQVATGYFDLRALDLEHAIAVRTLDTRRESLRLTEVREQGGATSLVDVRQAEQLVFDAQAAIIDLQRRIAQQENALSVLVGRNPGPIARGRPLTDQPHAPELPAGLPSALLERRPDVQEAEQMLVAANAEIGVARSAFLPRIALTGTGGVASTALSALFTGPALAWTAAASAVQPLFNAGRNRSEVALAEARQQEASLFYKQTVQNAFREVSDALIAYRRTRELRDTREQLVHAAEDARRLAELRYEGGAASYLEVLDSDTRLFNAELSLAGAERDELGAFVEIYRALGGGWQQ